MTITSPTTTRDVRPSLADRRRAARERLDLAPAPRRRRRTADGRSITRPAGPPPVAYYVIAVVVAVFVMLGLVMVLSASAANEVGQGNSPYRIFVRQLMWAGLGLVGLLIALTTPFERWRRFVLPIAVLSVGAMLLPFVPGLGVDINDTRAWIHVAGLSFQPSEVLKLSALALTADLFTRRHHELHEVRRGAVPLVIIAGIGSSLSLVQGDLGSSVVLGCIVLAVGFIAGVPLAHLTTTVLGGAAFIALFIISSPRRINRFTAFLDVAGNKDHISYQTHQGFLSMANGGLTGSGIGGSNAKLGYLPLAHSDFIFAVIADELGFVGSVAVVGGFALIVYFGIQVALASADRFSMLVAGGIAAWFGVQSLVNLGGVSGLMPVTGLTLPFFSAGGTSLFVMMVASGLLLNVARRAR